MTILSLVLWLAVVAWAAWFSYREGREAGRIEGEWTGREKASAEWEKAIQSRGLVLADNPSPSDEGKS